MNITEINKLITKKHSLDLDGYLNNIVNKKRAIIPVSPKIDLISGGVREGTMVLLVGPEKIGKTVFALQIAANAQNLNDGIKRRVYYLSVEGRLNPRDLAGIHGLKTDNANFLAIGSEEGKMLTAEDYLTIAEDIANNMQNSIIIVDSFSMMCSKSEMEYDYSDKFRMDAQKLCATFCRKNAGVLGINNNICIGILHLHANQNASGPFSKKTVEGGGTKLQYTGDYKFAFSHFKDWLDSENNPIGQDVYTECAFSPLTKPGMKTFFRLRYGHGIDEYQEILDLAKDLGVIKFGGAWIYFSEDNKLQGMEKAREYLVNNPAEFESLKQKVMEYIK